MSNAIKRFGMATGSFILTSAAPTGTFQAVAGAAVPEPSSFVISAIGALLGLGYAWRRHRREATA